MLGITDSDPWRCDDSAMKAAVGVIVTGVVIAIVGLVTWSRAKAAREHEAGILAFREAMGGPSTSPVLESAVSTGYAGVGILAFGALVLLTGVALAVIKAGQPNTNGG